MISPTSYVGTLHKLGWRNVLYVAWYKWSLKAGIRKRFFPVDSIEGGTFYSRESDNPITDPNYPTAWKRPLLQHANELTKGTLTYFFCHKHSVGTPPRWFLNPFNDREVANPNKHWTELGDFDLDIGDIKVIWEPSRFYWLPVLARAYKVTGEVNYLATINEWLNDWVKKNPLYIGPNWKCGQETSIRVMHLMLGTWILGQYEEPSEILQKMIWQHLQRIEGNIQYAVAQDNNHGTSEAAALYIGSSWLMHTGFKNSELTAFRDKGKAILEDRIQKLIKSDGTFSQYSVTYHRMVLDTMSWVLWNEDAIGLEGLSEKATRKVAMALNWMEAMLDESGDAPNFGPNDGSLICKLDAVDYRDFRPSVRLLKALLGKSLSAGHQPLDESLFWLNVEVDYQEESALKEQSSLLHFPESGLVRLNGDRSWMLFHYPRYEFRPSHCDFLHVDLWHNGQNILRDSGSYSYNTSPEFKPSSDYFKSVQSHNTVSFDGKEPIPKIGRFLYADWPKAEDVEIDKVQKSCQAKYRYRDKVDHRRSVEYLSEDRWMIMDAFDGNFENAVLRWRLASAEWELQPDLMTVESALARIIIMANAACKIKLDEGVESWYYQQYQPLPVLVLEGDSALKTISTYIELK